MRDFHNKLELALAEAVEPSRPLVIARLEVAEQVYHDIAAHFGSNTEASQKASHPEVPDRQYMHGPNPDAMITVDQNSKIWSMGTNNCVTCRHFVAGEPCPRWAEKGRGVVLNQAAALHFASGGCPLQQLLPELAEETPGGMTYPGELFERIAEETASENGDNLVIYRDGRIRTLPAADAGAGPERRGRDFEEFERAGDGDENEENWEDTAR